MSNPGAQLKMDGLDRVESNNRRWVDRARREAERVCAASGSVTADDLRTWADQADDQPLHPNAWGSVFRGKAWSCRGFQQSTYRSNHARMIRVWVRGGQ